MNSLEMFFSTDQALAGGAYTHNERKPMRREYGGSKLLAGRLAQVFNGCQLTLIEGEHALQPAKSSHLFGYLPAYPIDPTNLLEVSSFNNAFPKAFEVLLFSNHPDVLKASYMDGIGGIDVRNVHQLACDIAQGKKTAVTIRTVFGATEEMPFRALSYPIPGVVLAKALDRAGINAQVQVIFATNLSSAFSDADCKKAKDQARKLANLAKRYMHEFFPEIEDSVLFLEDVPLENGLGEKVSQLAGLVKVKASSQSRDALHAKDTNHGAAENHDLYGAAHLLMHDAVSSDFLVPLLDQPSMVKPAYLVGVGGKQEQSFYRLRHEVKPFACEDYNQVPTLQYFTKHHVPPYYPDREGDLSLDQAFAMKPEDFKEYLVKVAAKPDENTPVGRSARFDINYLIQVSERRGDLVEFIARNGGEN